MWTTIKQAILDVLRSRWLWLALALEVLSWIFLLVATPMSFIGKIMSMNLIILVGMCWLYNFVFIGLCLGFPCFVSALIIKRAKTRSLLKPILASCIGVYAWFFISFVQTIGLTEEAGFNYITAVKSAREKWAAAHPDTTVTNKDGSAAEFNIALNAASNKLYDLARLKAFCDCFFPGAMASVIIPPIIFLFGSLKRTGKATDQNQKDKRRRKIDFGQQ